MRTLGKLLLPALMAALLDVTLPLASAQGSPVWQGFHRESESLYLQGKFDAARVKAQQALHVAEQDGGPDSPAAFVSLNVLGASLARLGRYDEAAGALKRHDRSMFVHRSETMETITMKVSGMTCCGCAATTSPSSRSASARSSASSW